MADGEIVTLVSSPDSEKLTFASNDEGAFTATMRLHNSGEATVGLATVSSACSCTRVLSAPTEIAAGRMVELNVAVNPSKASPRTVWYDVSAGVVHIKGTIVLTLITSGLSTGANFEIAFSGKYLLPFRILESDLELSPVDVNRQPVSKLVSLTITDESLRLEIGGLPYGVDADVEKVGSSTALRLVVNVDALVATRPGKSMVPISVMLLATTGFKQQIAVPVTFRLPLRHPVTLDPQRVIAAPVEPGAGYVGVVRIVVNRTVTGPIHEIVRRDSSGDTSELIDMEYQIESGAAIVKLHFQAATNEGVSQLQLPLQIRCSNNDYELQIPITTVVRRKASP